MTGVFDVEIEFEAYCICGKQLDIDKAIRIKGCNRAIIIPCEDCLDKEHEKGFVAGCDEREDY